jgi:hypothetical protein
MSENEMIVCLFDELINAESYNFPPKGKLDITCALGVYIIFNQARSVIHVGRSLSGKKGICQRLNDHLAGNSSFVREFLNSDKNSLRNGYTFKFIVVADNRTRALLEYFTIGKLCPLHLGLGVSRKPSV